MNEPRITAALSALAEAAAGLADLCDREAPEFGPVWRTLSNNALALSTDMSREELETLARNVAILFGRYPGSFSEVYIKREDPAAQVAEEARFELAKDRVAVAAGELRAATKEGELDIGAIRRELTALETLLIEASQATAAGLVRDLLNRDPQERAIVLTSIEDLRGRLERELANDAVLAEAARASFATLRAKV